MTKRTKDAHIADSASGGKGESMARESRNATQWLQNRIDNALSAERYELERATFGCAHCSSRFHDITKLLAAYALSERRISNAPAQSPEARPGVGTAVESNAADEKGLASRVEELEQALRSLYEITAALEKAVVWEIEPSIMEFMKTTNRLAERALAGKKPADG